MEELIPILVLLVFGGLKFFGKIAQQGGKSDSGRPTAKPMWPGPIAGGGPLAGPRPGLPQQQAPWPSAPPARPTAQPVTQWPPAVAAPAEVGGEGIGSEGQSAMGFGSLADERARFQAERAQFRQAYPEGGLVHMRVEEPVDIEPAPAHPLAGALASKEGLAQAVLLAEVLGKPRALRPYGKR